MSRFLLLAGLVFMSCLSAAPLPRTSPHETISRKIEGNRVTIVYGRPYSRDPVTGRMRTIWGELVPYQKIWRLGADEATLFITQKPIELGGLAVPAGAHTLFFIAEKDGSAQLIVNKEIGQWGIDPYHVQNELGRVSLKKEALARSVDQFTIEIEEVVDRAERTTPGATNGNRALGVIKMLWEQTQYSVAYSLAKPDASHAGPSDAAARATGGSRRPSRDNVDAMPEPRV